MALTVCGGRACVQGEFAGALIQLRQNDGSKLDAHGTMSLLLGAVGSGFSAEGGPSLPLRDVPPVDRRGFCHAPVVQTRRGQIHETATEALSFLTDRAAQSLQRVWHAGPSAL